MMRERGDKCVYFAYAMGDMSLRLLEHMRRTYFSCGARSCIFIGRVGATLRLLQQVSCIGCVTCWSVFLGQSLGMCDPQTSPASESHLMRDLLECLHGAKARGLSLEAGLSVGGVCMLECGKGNGEGRQGTQDIEKDNSLKKEERCRCTGTPTLGLPLVFSGPVAVFMPCG
jgi:hypothetical protein